MHFQNKPSAILLLALMGCSSGAPPLPPPWDDTQTAAPYLVNPLAYETEPNPECASLIPADLNAPPGEKGNLHQTIDGLDLSQIETPPNSDRYIGVIQKAAGDSFTAAPGKTIALKDARQGDKDLIVPIKSHTLIYQGHSEPMHPGAIDFLAPIGSDVIAAAAGEVIKVDWDEWGQANAIKIAHSQLGIQTVYGHLHAVCIEVGDVINKGQIVGKVGSTGFSAFPHLHFEVRDGETGLQLETVESYFHSQPLLHPDYEQNMNEAEAEGASLQSQVNCERGEGKDCLNSIRG